jgi:hypothetical protein
MTQWLVSFDTDRIKEYLFATSTLSDIREASALLDRLNNQIGTAIVGVYPQFDPDDPGQLIYAAGGGAMALLPTKEIAERAIREVEKLYRQETVIASITGEKVEIKEGDHFGEKAHYLGHLLRKRKGEKGKPRVLPVAPFMRFCDACAQHPAVEVEGDEFICRACQVKRQRAKSEARRGLWKKLIEVTQEDKLPDEFPDEWQPLLDETLNKTYELHEFPRDFNDIGKSARRSGYIALIYADGNSMGSVLQKLPDAGAYRAFSQQVDDLLRRVTYKALMAQVVGRIHAPLFEVLMIGGDDLMLVTTPEMAFDVTLQFMQDFEQYSRPLGQRYGFGHLSLGTGIVIAKDSFPIQVMKDLATDLQKKKAKQRSFETGGGGAVDFMVVTSAGSESLDHIRDEVLTEKGFAFPPRPGGPAYRLTQRPYTIEELNRLIEHGQAIKRENVSQSQLQAMYEGVFHSPVQASLAALQTMGRVEKKQRKALRDFFAAFGPKSPLQFPPWRATQCLDPEKNEKVPCRDTALADLIEIYPFI